MTCILKLRTFTSKAFSIRLDDENTYNRKNSYNKNGLYGNPAHHSRIAKEKKEAALDEYEKDRYTVVGDLAVKAVEQAIEAAASEEGTRFHLGPKTAHAKRTIWAKQRFPEIAVDLDVVWGPTET